MLGIKQLAVMGAALTVSTMLAACEPAARAEIVVTTTAAGADDAPGDGSCASSVAGGGCTLQAALEEASATGAPTDIDLPAGTYRDADVTVSGDVRINPNQRPGVRIMGTIVTVAEGANLTVAAINTSTAVDGTTGVADFLRLDVAGRAIVLRSTMSHLAVTATGAVAIDRSAVIGLTAPTVVNQGSLVSYRSSLLVTNAGETPSTEAVLRTEAGGTTHLDRSVVARSASMLNIGFTYPGGGGTCAGVPPTSGGNVHIEVPCGSTPAPGDTSGPARIVTYVTLNTIDWRVTTQRTTLESTSPLVDAIASDDPRCEMGATDLYGASFGIDGNADEVGGCDVGAIERQP